MFASTRFATAVCCFIAVLLFSPAHAERSAEVQRFVAFDTEHILLRNIAIIAGHGAPARAAQDLLISNGQVAAIGPTGTLRVPGNAQVIGLEGYTVLPGYVMMHEHMMYRANDDAHFFVTNQPVMFPRLYLAAGVTTARTAGGVNVSQDLNIADEIRVGRLVGPDFDVTSPHMVGGLGHDFPYGTIGLPDLRSAAGARQFVDYWVARGVTSFKSHTHVSSAVVAAGIEAAHEHGMKFTGHLCSLTYREAAQMSIDNIEHGFFEATDFVADKKPDTCPAGIANLAGITVQDAQVQSLLDFLVDEKVAITSTLPVFVRGHKTLGVLPDGALAVLDMPTRTAYLERRNRMLTRPADVQQAEAQKIQTAMSLTRAFHDKGGLVMLGSDPTGMGGTIAGFANFEAIELLVEAGFTPLEALRAASLSGAEYMGRQDLIGTIEPGKQADLVVVAGRPDENIKDIRRVRIVFKQGIGYDADALFESAAGTIGAPGG